MIFRIIFKHGNVMYVTMAEDWNSLQVIKNNCITHFAFCSQHESSLYNMVANNDISGLTANAKSALAIGPRIVSDIL